MFIFEKLFENISENIIRDIKTGVIVKNVTNLGENVIKTVNFKGMEEIGVIKDRIGEELMIIRESFVVRLHLNISIKKIKSEREAIGENIGYIFVKFVEIRDIKRSRRDKFEEVMFNIKREFFEDFLFTESKIVIREKVLNLGLFEDLKGGISRENKFMLRINGYLKNIGFVFIL